MVSSRREWLASLLAVGAGAVHLLAQDGGLGQFGVAGPPCTPGQKPTPAVPADGTYKAGAPVRSALLQAGATGTPLKFSGTVAGTKCGRIKGAEVDLWHANSRGQLDTAGYQFRGRQVTDANGNFVFDTIVPGAAASRAAHLSVRVHVPQKAELWTELFFSDDPARLQDRRFNPGLELKVTRIGGRVSAVYDVLFDL